MEGASLERVSPQFTALKLSMKDLLHIQNVSSDVSPDFSAEYTNEKPSVQIN